MERRRKMGVMTNDMKRLRGEVEALRVARGTLLQDLALEAKQRRDAVVTMQAGFRKTYGNLARKAKNARVAFVTDLAAGAIRTIAGFHKSRTAVAKRAGAERLAFVLGQKQAVADLRHAVAADLAGAHRFWCGPLAAPLHAQRQAEDVKGKKPRPSARPRKSHGFVPVLPSRRARRPTKSL
jgi:hypothetical protein